VNVDIENGIGYGANSGDPALLFGLAQCNAQDVAFSVGMSAQLQPFVELPVVRKQGMRAIPIDNPRRTRDMPDLERTFKAILIRRDEALKASAHRRFFRSEWFVTRQQFEEWLPPHFAGQSLQGGAGTAIWGMLLDVFGTGLTIARSIGFGVNVSSGIEQTPVPAFELSGARQTRFDLPDGNRVKNECGCVFFGCHWRKG
jgi:hypothetical protein